MQYTSRGQDAVQYTSLDPPIYMELYEDAFQYWQVPQYKFQLGTVPIEVARYKFHTLHRHAINVTSCIRKASAFIVRFDLTYRNLRYFQVLPGPKYMYIGTRPLATLAYPVTAVRNTMVSTLSQSSSQVPINPAYLGGSYTD